MECLPEGVDRIQATRPGVSKQNPNMPSRQPCWQPPLSSAAPQPKVPSPSTHASPASQGDIHTPFTTTSDVLKKLNVALSEMYENDGGGGEAVEDMEKCQQLQPQCKTPLCGSINNNSNNKPHFELQKRFEDGYSRPATNSELKASDLDSKVKQVAQHLSQLDTDDERNRFLESHIAYANDLYAKGQYEEAMDAYVTCLTGTEPKSHPVRLARILHNLAQSALKIKGYQRCIRVCTIALEQLQLEEKKEEDEGMEEEDEGKEQEEVPPSNPVLVNPDLVGYAAKLHFKRAKARRLLGLYDEALGDLDRTSLWLARAAEQSTALHTSAGAAGAAAQRQALEEERAILARSIQRGEHNHTRQRHAMQRFLGGDRENVSLNDATDSNGAVGGADAARRSSPLYPPNPTNSAAPPSQRQCSTLRAPSRTVYTDDNKDSNRTAVVDDDSDDEPCWQRFVGFVRLALFAILPRLALVESKSTSAVAQQRRPGSRRCKGD